ncbi:hypothetical protein TNCV_3615321 [Trichonephila clavipes]|nr:hypothetical protein TNCV_3615321 [Trichonephila clavipes]
MDFTRPSKTYSIELLSGNPEVQSLRRISSPSQNSSKRLPGSHPNSAVILQYPHRKRRCTTPNQIGSYPIGFHNIWSAGCSQRDTPDCTPCIKVTLGKSAVDCLPKGSSSRHSSKITSKLISRRPPMSQCALWQEVILSRCHALWRPSWRQYHLF